MIVQIKFFKKNFLKTLFFLVATSLSVPVFSQATGMKANLLTQDFGTTSGYTSSGWTRSSNVTYACAAANFLLYSSTSSGNYFYLPNFHVPRGKGVSITFNLKRSSGSATLSMYARVGGYGTWNTLSNNYSGWMPLVTSGLSYGASCASQTVTVPGDICGGQDLCILFKASGTNICIDDIVITDAGPASTVPNIATGPLSYSFDASTKWYGPLSDSYFDPSSANKFSYSSRYGCNNGSGAYAYIANTGGNGGKVNQATNTGGMAYVYLKTADCGSPGPSGLPCFITKEFNTSTCTGSTATLRFAFFTTYAGYTNDEDYKLYCPRIYYMTTADASTGSWTEATVNYYFPNGKWWYAATSLPKAQNLIVAFVTKSTGDNYTNIDDIKIVNNDCSICTQTGGAISCTSNPGLSTYGLNTDYTFTIGATTGAAKWKWIVRDLTTSGNPFYYGTTAGATPYIKSGQTTQTATINFGTNTGNTYRVMCIPYDEDYGTDAAPTDACYAKLSYYSDVTPACASGTWTGATDRDWDVATNWTCNVLPISTTDVIIPNVANEPIVSSTGVSECKSITIDASSSVTVNSGKDLSVYGNWTNSGQNTVGTGTVIFKGGSAQTINGSTTFENLTINNSTGVTLNNNTQLAGILTPTAGTLASGGKLTLLSTASQTALISGTGSGSVSGNVTMQRYMPNRLGYHYYSSPFDGAPISMFADEMGPIITANPYIGDDLTNNPNPFPNFYIYNETKTNPIIDIGWDAAGSNLETITGYCINFGNSTASLTTDVTGVVNNGAYSIGVTKTSSGVPASDGWNLVGNPYPSPINWKAAAGWTKTNVNDGVYYFKANSLYGGTYSSFVNNVGVNGGTALIPSMQAFWVNASANGTLGVANSVRTTDLNPTFYKLAKSADALLRLKGFLVSNDSLSDETVIYFDSLASFMFDGNLDALKLLNNEPTFPNIFTRDSSVYSLSISSLPPLSNTDVVIPLGFTTKTGGNFTIEATEILNFDPLLHIYLEDNQEEIIQDLKINPNYSFSINTGDPLYRFFIRFSTSSTTGIPYEGSSFINAWSSGNDIFINFSSSLKQNAEMSLFNMLGQKVICNEQIGIGTSSYKVEKPGCYIINVISGHNVYMRKIVIM